MENFESEEPKILIVIKKLAKKREVTVKEIIEKGTGMTEAGFYLALRKDTIRVSTLRTLANYLEIPINVFLDEKQELKNNIVEKPIDSSFYDFLKRENEFLRGFIKEKFAVNFNPVSGLATVFLGLFFWLY